jgi:hypothetical protein
MGFSRGFIFLDKVRGVGVGKLIFEGCIVFAEVAELVDALGSGSSGCTAVRVQIPASAPKEKQGVN